MTLLVVGTATAELTAALLTFAVLACSVALPCAFINATTITTSTWQAV
jgi:hypothetical protein